ncbi:MAG: hypothetical protein J7L54_02010 [Elusimicrobia bacterium]|nr:hypothetical protein [Elusimicrobiota bacterium]
MTGFSLFNSSTKKESRIRRLEIFRAIAPTFYGAVVCCLLPMASSFVFANFVGGYYECYYEAWRDGEFRMNISQPKHYLQLKTWLEPAPNSGIYSQISASTWENDAKIKFDRGFVEKTFFKKAKLMLLYQEERHWISSPLLYLVDTGKIQKNARAVRLDFWNFGRFRGNFVFSKDLAENNCEWYGNYFDVSGSASIGRLEYYSPVFKIGTNFIMRKKKYEKYSISGSTKTFISDGEISDTVNSADFRFDFPRFSFIGETALTKFASGHNRSNSAWQLELRDLFLGPFDLTFSAFDYGKYFFVESSRKFSGYDGNSEFGRNGYYGEIRFLVPGKAVDLSYKFSNYKTEVEKTENDTGVREHCTVTYYADGRHSVLWNFAQVYVRMLRGINFRAGLENNSGTSSRKNVSFRIEGETPKGLSGLTFKIADFGKKEYPGEKYIIGTDQKLNLTDNLQLYLRFARGSTKDIFWQSGFAQLKYFIGYDFEIYLECGESWPTDSLYSSTAFADDTSLDFSKVVKFIMKMSF